MIVNIGGKAMKIYNTLTRRKEEFIPIEEGKVRMYVCGPTVYNYIHIGNARPTIVFDTVRRYFEYKGYEVKYVSNFTDVDDKIIKKANEEGVSATEISERYIKEFRKDMEALNNNDLNTLGELMDINHGLLRAIGVSSKELDELVYVAKENGALGAKLTGAGGGGCMIALSKLEDREKISKAICKVGSTPIIAEKADKGVRCWEID